MSSKFKRCKRYNDPNHSHELTFSCFKRQRFLARNRAAQWLINAIELSRKRHAFHDWAYVIMPEHADVLIWPTTPGYSVSKILATIKLSVTRNALQYVRTNAPHFLGRMQDAQPNGQFHYRFWQRGGGYDRNGEKPATIWSQIAYIHENPVRRGLCCVAEDWHWSSAASYSGLCDGPLTLDRESLPGFE